MRPMSTRNQAGYPQSAKCCGASPIPRTFCPPANRNSAASNTLRIQAMIELALLVSAQAPPSCATSELRYVVALYTTCYYARTSKCQGGSRVGLPLFVFTDDDDKRGLRAGGAASAPRSGGRAHGCARGKALVARTRAQGWCARLLRVDLPVAASAPVAVRPALGKRCGGVRRRSAFLLRRGRKRAAVRAAHPLHSELGHRPVRGSVADGGNRRGTNRRAVPPPAN